MALKLPLVLSATGQTERLQTGDAVDPVALGDAGQFALSTLNGAYWAGTPTALVEALDRIAAVVSVFGTSPIP